MLTLRHHLIVGLIMGWACCGSIASAARAQAPTDLAATALSIAPQDAAFLLTAIDMRKSWETFAQGNFVKSLRRLEYVRSLEQELLSQWEHPAGQIADFKSALRNPNIRDLLRLAADMASHEFFIYGEDDWCDTIENLIAFQNEIMTQIQQDPNNLEEFFNQLDRETVDGLRVPTTIFGFRLSDEAVARQQLDALEGIIRVVGGQQKEIRPFLEKLHRKDLADGQTLTMTLDTSLIPLDKIDEDQREVVDKVLELLEGRSASLSLAVKSNLLLIGVGEGADLLEKVGEASSKLIDHERMSVLKEAATSDVRTILFASKRWRQSQWNASFEHYFRNLFVQFSVAIDSEADEDGGISDAEKWKEELLQDAERLDEMIADVAPDFGDMLAWSHAITSGSEGWSYDWSSNPLFESVSPMQILEHAGANSLYLLAFKHRALPALNELCDYAMERIPEHAVRFIAAAERDEEDRELALRVFKQAWPLAEEAAEILRDKIAPALDEKESLLSLSAAWTTRELGNDLPRADEPLTLPELAIACKLRDRELFLEGCQELYGVFDKVVELVREVDQDAIPADYEIPRPVEEAIGEASSYHYEELTSAVGMAGFKPQLVIADDVVIFGYSDRQVRDMLGRRALATRPAWLTDETPVAAVGYADYGGMLAAMRPWIMYGFSMSGMPLNQPLAPADGPVPSANDLLQIWDTFSAAGVAAATVSTDDSGPTVAHWVWVSR
ncbi:MAG: hypothetical protein KDA72_03890 [Planctomycetales bacterium]|nr:hypothetical protein [Planctomycetales bacterium]